MCTGKYEAGFNLDISVYVYSKLRSGDKSKLWKVFQLLPYEI
jgi:hypothetical protein